ncbi:hypothetical protein I553_1118 [Mycobacterium xenopi 4042]|uniref:Uncharacterized protein n=1 Tax=Mycobacterium xenopi 4042 TaxID=1299334 RepID=X7ZBL2_MYCXE|nr:hypothetical protein I553_1118 [Mycobacterium xenopi 4042]
MGQTDPSEIFDKGQRSGAQNFQGCHGWSPMRLGTGPTCPVSIAPG